MKFFDWLVVILFVVGFIFGAAWAKAYLIPKFIPGLVSAKGVSQRAALVDRRVDVLPEVAVVLVKGV